MSTRKEREVILNSIEDEYRHDLSLHLYSTFLLHQINPLFPRRNWASWPLPIDRVPDPRSSKIFVDSDNGIEHENLDHEINNQRGKEAATKEQELTDIEDESAGSSDDEVSISKNEEIHENRHKRYMRIRSVATQESLSNSKVDIMIELHALLEKKIHRRLKASADTRSLVMSADVSSKMTKEVCKKLANKVDHLVNNIISFQKQGNTRLSSSRPYSRLLNWQDILLAGLDVDESHDKILRTTSHANLYQKCERLFDNTKYTYEYDNEEDEEEDDNEDEEEEEDDDDDQANNGSGAYINSIGQEKADNIREKPEFNYLDYLSKVEETHSGVINYKNFKERTLKNWNQEDKLRELKKLIFMRKLHLQTKYSSIDWNEASKRPKVSDRKTPKKFRIQNEDKDSQKDHALAHGGIQLTAEDFTVNI